jgi:rhodanese-related sulfurtransferase
MKSCALTSAAALLALVGAGGAMAENRITPNLQAVEVLHHGKVVTLTRSDDRNATLPRGYDRVSRHCPPFCIQPMQVLPGVETIGELEVIGYLKRMAAGDQSILVVDSREPDWTARGTIPGSVSVPWTQLDIDRAGAFAAPAETKNLERILVDLFGATKTDTGWDFSQAKTLVLFCNGIWCGQSSRNIHTLTRLGYPPEKLKWYRGGMQDWVSVGLTTVTP